MDKSAALGRVNKAFDKFWEQFDDLWKQFDKVFNEELPESTVVKNTIRVTLTPTQAMELLTGQRKRFLFKVKDDVAIQVEVNP